MTSAHFFLILGVVACLAGCGQTPSSSSNSGDQIDAITSGSENISENSPIRWGSDEAGGAPYEFRDPENPDNRIGFEVDIANEIGRRLKRPVTFVQAEWSTLIPALNRGDFDMAMSGLEITPEREAAAAFTQPYYIYRQQLVVRAEDTTITQLSDLRGHEVGTLGGCSAEKILADTPGITVKGYDDNVRPYDDLAIGRIDGVLLDLPIALYFASPNNKLRFAGSPFAPGKYAIAVRKADTKLLRNLNMALAGMKSDGTLEKILTKWKIWDDMQTSMTASTLP